MRALPEPAPRQHLSLKAHSSRLSVKSAVHWATFSKKISKRTSSYRIEKRNPHFLHASASPAGNTANIPIFGHR